MRRLPSEPVSEVYKRKQYQIQKTFQNRMIAVIVTSYLCLLFLLLIFFFNGTLWENFKYRTNGINCEFQCLDFDYGNAILFESSGENFLIDSGNGNHGEELLGFLTSEEIDSINYLFISELSEEYLQSLDMIINSVTVDKIVLPSTDDEQLQKIFDDYIASTPVISQTAIEGMSFRIGKSTVDVTDVSSLSIKLSFGKNKFLILNSEYVPEDKITDFDAIIRNLESFIEIEDISSEKIYRTYLNGDILIKSNEVDLKIKCEKQ